MTNLISGKEALIALVKGEEVENFNGSVWWSVDKSWEVGAFLSDRKFRLKPKTTKINGIEVPAPFKPEDGEKYWIITDEYKLGYTSSYSSIGTLGKWRTEEEIKQVVVALRSVFKTK